MRRIVEKYPHDGTLDRLIEVMKLAIADGYQPVTLGSAVPGDQYRDQIHLIEETARYSRKWFAVVY